jgi:hypothetical protein
MTSPDEPKPLPEAAKRWAVKVDGVHLTYGDVHQIMHRDISIGNDYRKERIKLAIALAGAAFALTVTFHKDVFGGRATGIGLILMLIGWVLLLCSLLAGIVHLWKWEDFYLEHRATATALWAYRTNHEEKTGADVADDAKTAAAAKAEAAAKALGKFNAASDRIAEFQEAYRWWNRAQLAGLLLGLMCLAANVLWSSWTVMHEAKAGAGTPALSAAPPQPPPADAVQQKR